VELVNENKDNNINKNNKNNKNVEKNERKEQKKELRDHHLLQKHVKHEAKIDSKHDSKLHDSTRDGSTHKQMKHVLSNSNKNTKSNKI
jgi:hypothetical protein